MDKLFLTRNEAAGSLSISVDTLDRLANSGHIQRLKIGAKTCYARSEVNRFAEELIRKGAISLA